MKYIPTAPSRVDGFPEPGDRVALADHRGNPVGEWVLIEKGATELRLRVPATAPHPVSKYLVRDPRGRWCWWSGTTWAPPARPGEVAVLPITPAPSVTRPEEP